MAASSNNLIQVLGGLFGKGQQTSNVPAATQPFFQPTNTGANSALLETMMARSRAGRNPTSVTPVSAPVTPTPAPATPAPAQGGGPFSAIFGMGGGGNPQQFLQALRNRQSGGM